MGKKTDTRETGRIVIRATMRNKDFYTALLFRKTTKKGCDRNPRDALPNVPQGSFKNKVRGEGANPTANKVRTVAPMPKVPWPMSENDTDQIVAKTRLAFQQEIPFSIVIE